MGTCSAGGARGEEETGDSLCTYGENNPESRGSTEADLHCASISILAVSAAVSPNDSDEEIDGGSPLPVRQQRTMPARTGATCQAQD